MVYDVKQKGDVLFRVPKRLIFSLDEANSTELGELIKIDKLLGAMPNVSLALLLLYAKTSKNTKFQKWKPYLDILPSEFNTPLYFSLDEIRSLQSSYCFSNDIFVSHAQCQLE